MSFYRTYRPNVIDEIDNVAVREQLLSLLSKDKKQLPHAYLFTGARGAGKTTAARLLAKLFNCTKSNKNGPCGKCDQCASISVGRNLDVLEIDAASNRGIDEIRTLRDAINLTPSASQFKVYIIDEVHMLTAEAFNALLKTLEEPPAHVVFILATTDPQKVPATIKSRCVHITFHKATEAELVSALKRIIQSEKITIADDALHQIVISVDGSFRDAVKMLEQVSFHKGNIKLDTVLSLTSATHESQVQKFCEYMYAKDNTKALGVIRELVSDGKDIKAFVIECLKHLQKDLLSGNVQSRELIRLFTEAFSLMKISPIPELPLELVVVEYCGDTNVIKEVKREEKKEEIKEIAGNVSLEKLTEHWLDFIASLKPYNNSVAGVMRSARPKAVDHGIVTIEAFYPFHKDKLSESKTKDILIDVLKKLFGEKVKVEIVLGKK